MRKDWKRGKFRLLLMDPASNLNFPRSMEKKKSPYLQSFVVSLVTSCDEYEQTY